MKKYDVSLSRDELYLVLSCLSSCGARCFSFGNTELGNSYVVLHDKLENLVFSAFRENSIVSALRD